jgi:divalent metal cation (Fe/Co/Zn/Cd) transporter
MGMAVALFILYSAHGLIVDSVSPLLGDPPSAELVEAINKKITSYPGVIDTHDLIIHDYGPGRMMISLHAEVPADADILEMHDAIDQIEKELRDTLLCDAVIHMDPIATDDEQVLAVKKKVAALVTCIDKSLTIHDFRMVVGPTHTNVIFDITVPFEVKKSDGEIRESIETIIKTIDPNYFAVVNIEKSYI